MERRLGGNAGSPFLFIFGGLMEMVDVLDLGSSVSVRTGSSPVSSTKL